MKNETLCQTNWQKKEKILESFMVVQRVKDFAMIKFRALAHHVFVYFRVKKYVKSKMNEIPV